MPLRRRHTGETPPTAEPTVPESENRSPNEDLSPPDTATQSSQAPELSEAAVVSRLDEVCDELASLRTLFEERLRYDEVREAHFSRIYAELDQYKQDEASRRMLGLARSLILLLDKLRDADLPSEFVRGEIEECLSREGVEIVAADDESPGIEEVVGFLDESDCRDRHVLGEGFKYDGRIVRPRRVLVRRGPGS